ncbi:MAG TPA: alanine racemase [Gemmatimonadales bacterium]
MNAAEQGRDDRAWVEVDLAAVVANARSIARVSGARLLPVVKADGYGLGAVPIARALEALDPWGYGVATAEEGAALRAAGILRPILVLSPGRPALFGAFDALRLTPALGDADSIAAWTARGERTFHVEIDTGMGRAGIRWSDVDALREVCDTPYFEGCYSHPHSAERDDGSAEAQLERFQGAVARLPRRPALLHFANSAAALRGRKFACDLVRPGIFLYGGLGDAHPVVRLRARVVSLRRVRRGESVSYGARWSATRDTTVATLGIGYADGVRRGLASEARVLIHGRACPVAGTVTMDMMMVDAGDLPVAVGDVATLIGSDGASDISLHAWAAWSGTVTYEVLTSLGPRLPRVHTG